MRAIEDCRHLSRRLERDLVAAGQAIVRVPPKLMAHVRDSARTYGKSDPIDALAVARAAQREPDLPVARPDGPDRDVRPLSDHRESLVAERTRVICRLRWHLHELDLAWEPKARALDRISALDQVEARIACLEGTVARLARILAGRCRELTAQINELTTELTALNSVQAPALIAIPGCGALTAAKILGEIAAVDRFRSKDAAPVITVKNLKMIISAGASGRSRWRLTVNITAVVSRGVPVKRATGEHNRRSRPGRGLSLDRIVTAALELVDEQGIGAASMRAVSSRLGVRSMSLYRYVQDRDELFDEVVERIVNELADDPEVQLRPVDGWRPYLTGMAHGVRRYARAHPHAFPLVATRPPGAPWVNPPLRSLRWVEAMLSGLAGEGFSDEQVLFTYRTFNGFLLGYLLLETSAMTLRDPKPGDGSFTSTDTASDDGSGPGGGAPARPVTGGLSPARSADQREAVQDAGSPGELLDPADEIDARRFPTLHTLAAGLAEDRWEEEFETGLAHMLDRIAMLLADGSDLARE